MENTQADTNGVTTKNEETLFGTIRGRVTYARGPVALAQVKCQPPASESPNPATSDNSKITTSPEPQDARSTETLQATPMLEPVSATTDLSGAYEIAKLKPGIYDVSVIPPKGWNYKADPQSLDLKSGEVKVADFKLEPIPLETIFTGRVFDSEGHPAVGARLGGVICRNNIDPVTLLTDSEGRFLFKDVVPGDRFVRIMFPGHIAELQDFDIEEGQTLSQNFNLKKAAHKIQGTVTNNEGKPVEASVQLFTGGPMQAMVIQKAQTTREDGKFEFDVNDGQYSILVQAAGYELAAWVDSVYAHTKANIELVPFDPKRHTHPVLSPTEAEAQNQTPG